MVCVCVCMCVCVCVSVLIGEVLAMTCLPKYLRYVAMSVCVAILNLISL